MEKTILERIKCYWEQRSDDFSRQSFAEMQNEKYDLWSKELKQIIGDRIALQILDVGTGCGLISLMVAQRASGNLHIIGIDSDKYAIECARANVAASCWPEFVSIIHSGFENFVLPDLADLIVSNPPFYTTGMLSPNNARATARHCNGTLSPVTLISYAYKHLAPGGSLAMVTPAEIEQTIVFESTIQQMRIVRQCDVITVPDKKPRRILWQMQRSCDSTASLEHTTLTIRKQDGKFTEEYRNLTSAFYLDF